MGVTTRRAAYIDESQRHPRIVGLSGVDGEVDGGTSGGLVAALLVAARQQTERAVEIDKLHCGPVHEESFPEALVLIAPRSRRLEVAW